MGEFGWPILIAAVVFLFGGGNAIAIAKGWVAFRESLKDLKAQVDALAKEKVPVLECHDKHATEREENRREHEALNRNLVKLSAQGVQPANPHPKLEPLPGQEWEE